MKVHSKYDAKPKGKAGRKKRIGGMRDSFFPGERLVAVIADLQKRCRKLNVSSPSRSLIYRQGAFMFINKMNADLRSAVNGELHAKKRKQTNENTFPKKGVLAARPRGTGRIVLIKNASRLDAV